MHEKDQKGKARRGKEEREQENRQPGAQAVASHMQTGYT
jgi:hypothetical protein